MSETFSRKYGPWAIVTGASDGIGRAMATELARRGLSLVLVARRGDVLRSLASSLKQSHGVETLAVPLDLSEPDAHARLCARVDSLDVGLLIASAGFGTSGPFVDSPLADEISMLDVNCRAVLEQCSAFGARFRARGRGGIVLFGSLVGFQGVPGAAHYAATKAYIQSLGEGLHYELKPLGVDVLVCAPGPVATGFASRARMTLGSAESPETVAKETIASLGRKMTVRPGFQAKFLGWSLDLLPRGNRVRMMKTVMAGAVASGARTK